ncbi:alpha/beta hydrolase [Streptomyces sp. NBC_00390]|uniref:alpha/beta fold hydrolase n=1 Tax=Streptomyces sp. NBC_00390 TaxID=2975736 RepID=UPI002E1E40C7
MAIRSVFGHSRSRRGGAVTAVLAVTAFAAVGPAAAADATPTGPGDGAGSKPTVVLVHGAFADASGWNGVTERLQREGYNVVVPANPLRGLAGDSAYIASVLKAIQGPIVLVGHSYGGAVISSAAAGNPSVKSLVYIAAFMPDKGEALGQLAAKFLGSELGTALKQSPFRNADGSNGTDLSIQLAKFREVFAADLPAATTAVMARSQRPISASALMDKAPAAAWRTIPSWSMIATGDKTIPPDLERFGAKRAGSHTVEVNSSHVAMLSHPDAVTDLIRQAAAGRPPAKPALADTGPSTLALAGFGAAATAMVLTGAGLVLSSRRRGPAR